MREEKNIMILGIVCIAVALASYIAQLHLEIRRARAERNFEYCGFTETDIGTTQQLPIKTNSFVENAQLIGPIYVIRGRNRYDQATNANMRFKKW